MTNRPKIGILVDRMAVARWQAGALRLLAGRYDLLIYSCRNTLPGRRRLRHGFYYLLNLVTIRNSWTLRKPLSPDLPIIGTRTFTAKTRGAWQSLPEDLISQIRQDQPVVIVKFGMGLLEVPPIEQFPVPILSYHHGDPAWFRGRPAGFYELLSGTPTMGQVVQRLSNRLDAGAIVASAQTKVLPHSYRATLVEAYRHSPLILHRAVENCLRNHSWTPCQWGRNYRLPGNVVMLRFLFGRWRHGVSRLLYALFKEKRWSVATASVGDIPSLDALGDELGNSAAWRVLPTPSGYRFLADPFFHPRGGLLVEALNTRSSRGEILHLTESAILQLSQRGGHYSYPATIREDDRWYAIPEISDWSPPQAFAFGKGGFRDPVRLRIAGSPRLLDPTPFVHGASIYLFGNIVSEGASVLRLWFARNLRSEFVEHPASPICISPNGARMAGRPAQIGPNLVRFGQDFRRGYGDGVTAFAITRIDEQHYQEEIISELRFKHCRGPHTLNLYRGQIAFDFYTEEFSPFAGIRRWRDRRAAQRTD